MYFSFFNFCFHFSLNSTTSNDHKWWANSLLIEIINFTKHCFWIYLFSSCSFQHHKLQLQVVSLILTLLNSQCQCSSISFYWNEHFVSFTAPKTKTTSGMSKPSLFRLVSNKTLFHFCLLIFINLTTYCFIYIDIFGVQSLTLGPGATTTSGMFFFFFFFKSMLLWCLRN